VYEVAAPGARESAVVSELHFYIRAGRFQIPGFHWIGLPLQPAFTAVVTAVLTTSLQSPSPHKFAEVAECCWSRLLQAARQSRIWQCAQY
jgi:hypothetical protein